MSKKSSNKKVFSFKKYLVIFLVILSILFSGLIYFINVLPLEYFWVFIVTLGIIDVIVSLLLLSNGHVRNLVGGFFSFILIIGMIFGINYSLNTMDFFKQFGGEGELELRERMNKTLTEIMNENDHQVVLAVSHGAACAQFYRAWEEHAKVKKTERFYNCCIQKYEYEDGIFTLVEIFNRNITE